ncbi:hypothetical protein Tco_0974787 [Tanacetum coccineum]|uniref:Uncharacterized protein n=1 Tax=Tanacetum coccineum TaxID=301880 RepID=A0ABQ5ECL3_9ASTR
MTGAKFFDIEKFDGTGDSGYGGSRPSKRTLWIPCFMDWELTLEDGEELIVNKGFKRQSRGKVKIEVRGGRLKCYICQSEGSFEEKLSEEIISKSQQVTSRKLSAKLQCELKQVLKKRTVFAQVGIKDWDISVRAGHTALEKQGRHILREVVDYVISDYGVRLRFRTRSNWKVQRVETISIESGWEERFKKFRTDHYWSAKSLLKKEFDMKELRGRQKKILEIDNGNRFRSIGGHFKLSVEGFCQLRDCDVERMEYWRILIVATNEDVTGFVDTDYLRIRIKVGQSLELSNSGALSIQQRSLEAKDRSRHRDQLDPSTSAVIES